MDDLYAFPSFAQAAPACLPMSNGLPLTSTTGSPHFFFMAMAQGARA
jgi:hypothetical protein